MFMLIVGDVDLAAVIKDLERLTADVKATGSPKSACRRNRLKRKSEALW